MGLLVFFFVASILVSFLCSIWEAVILSITPSFTNRKIQEGTLLGSLMKTYKDDIDRPLAAILTLNTISHTVGAIGVGVQAGKLFGEHIINLGITTISYESIIAAAMTLAILLLSEIIPKTIGANMWRQLAPFTIRSLRVLIWILHPLVWLSQWITRRLKKDKERSIFSKADFAAMTHVGFETGALDQSESTIIQNLLRLGKLLVRDIMTPRSVIVIADEQSKVKEFYETYKPFQFSRIPVYTKNPDQITGVILKDDLLVQMAEDHEDKELSDLRRDVLFVKDTDNLSRLLDALVLGRQHIAIVTDTYGSVTGLVTMEDLFETILGFEIVDESDKIEDLQGFARKKWEERAKKLGLKK
jgi:CBS domain containing-hemolysin-like protein